MTIQELLSLSDQDRGAAWRALQSALLSGAAYARPQFGIDRAEVDDIVQDGLVRAVTNDFAALRAAGGSVLLSSWARGVARNLVRERLRAKSLSRLGDEPPGRPETPPDGESTGWEALDLSSLTEKEAAAIRERIGGRSEREGAGKLGIGRSTFRDRVERAVRQLKRAHGTLAPLPEMSRAWAEQLLNERPSWLRARDRKCLRLYAEGAARGEIAEELDTTVDGVHGLLGRLKRRFLEER